MLINNCVVVEDFEKSKTDKITNLRLSLEQADRTNTIMLPIGRRHKKKMNCWRIYINGTKKPICQKLKKKDFFRLLASDGFLRWIDLLPQLTFHLEKHQRHAIWQNGPKCVWRIWCIWRVYVFEISPKYVDRIWRIYVFDFFLKKIGMPRIWRIWRVYVFDFFPISFNAPYLTYLMCLRIWVFTNKI